VACPRYSALGCPTLAPPRGGWIHVERRSARVGCNSTSDVWKLTCDGKRWNGPTPNCSAHVGESVPAFCCDKNKKNKTKSVCSDRSRKETRKLFQEVDAHSSSSSSAVIADLNGFQCSCMSRLSVTLSPVFVFQFLSSRFSILAMDFCPK